jgi:hypothetical protein
MSIKTDICFSCNKIKPLTKEHIIPQALGGKLTAWIYCKDCNDRFGRKIDNELIKNIGYFATALNIDRDRGKNRPYDVTLVKKGTKLLFNGKELKRKKPIVEIKKNGDKIKSVDVIARSEIELREKITQIKTKYSLDAEFKDIHEDHSGPVDVKFDFVIDNSRIRRAVSKIAYSLLCTKLSAEYVFASSFDQIRTYIRSGSKNDLATANYRYTDFMTDGLRPLHKIHISLNRQKNIVAGFVCLFGTFRYTVLLSNNFKSTFEWPGLDYTFDPVTLKEIYGNQNFRASLLGINEILSPKQSKQLVLSGLAEGHIILDNYIQELEFLKTETED